MSVASLERLAVAPGALDMLTRESGAARVEYWRDPVAYGIKYVFTYPNPDPDCRVWRYSHSVSDTVITLMSDEEQLAGYLKETAHEARRAYESHVAAAGIKGQGALATSTPQTMTEDAPSPVTMTERFDALIETFAKLNEALALDFTGTALNPAFSASVVSNGEIVDVREEDEFEFKGVVFMRNDHRLGVLMERRAGAGLAMVYFSARETEDLFDDIAGASANAIGRSLSALDVEARQMTSGRRELARALSDATYKTLDRAREKSALKQRNDRAHFYGNNTNTGLF